MQEESVTSKMSSVLQSVTNDIGSVRTGRATPALVEDISVNAYGGAQRMRVVELATITIPDPQTIVIEPWDKTIIGEIRQGILAANVGFNPLIDTQIIRISLPPMTAEDRQKYVKLLKTKIENGKVMVRQVRADAMHDIKKGFEGKSISEDEKFAQEKKLQELTDDYIGRLEEIAKKKEEELLQL
jgi:ribosome recycling factor